MLTFFLNARKTKLHPLQHKAMWLSIKQSYIGFSVPYLTHITEGTTHPYRVLAQFSTLPYFTLFTYFGLCIYRLSAIMISSFPLIWVP